MYKAILGYNIFCRTKEACLEQIFSCVSNTKSRVCYTLACMNPHSYIVSLKNESFVRALCTADLLVPDGIGILLASKLLKKPVVERITGFDVFTGVSERLNSSGMYRVFFLGSTEDTLKKIVAKYQIDYSNLVVAGTHSPPFKNQYTSGEVENIITIINSSRADVLWIALTAPKQELLLSRIRENLNTKFAACIGAVFDYYAGTISHPPFLVRKFGLEWLYRFFQEHRRLFKRNFVSAPKFVYIVFKSYVAELIKL